MTDGTREGDVPCLAPVKSVGWRRGGVGLSGKIADAQVLRTLDVARGRAKIIDSAVGRCFGLQTPTLQGRENGVVARRFAKRADGAVPDMCPTKLECCSRLPPEKRRRLVAQHLWLELGAPTKRHGG